MKLNIENGTYNTRMEASDWRFSASIIGLIDYLIFHGLDYEMDDEYLYYNNEDITEERYLEFVEYKYPDELHHKIVENILSNQEINEEQIKLVNEKLSGNTIMKEKFNKIKFYRTNKEEILNIISANRLELIRETFGKKSNLYANYVNINMKAPVEIFKESQAYCRLLGYSCADKVRKSKALGYNFNKNSYISEDISEFDFIPFSFIGNRESFFINDNFTLKRLNQSNKELENKVKIEKDNNKFIDSRKVLFKSIIESSDFIDYDVEVIYKDVEKDYFETLYFRKDSIDILKEIKDYDVFCRPYKLDNNEWINMQKEVTMHILNNLVLDDLIELSLKNNKTQDRSYIIKQLIKLNVLIRGDKDMNGKKMSERLKGAFACAKQVAEKLPQNKLDSYRQKLTSSIIFKDYNRACQILLQLSNYSDVDFGFAYDLFENFEENKDLAYTFVNALSKNKEEKTNENN